MLPRRLALPVSRFALATASLVAPLVLGCALPAAAAAAAPANDDREGATALDLPALTKGTTAGATVEEFEPTPSCGDTAGSLWYRVTPKRSARIVVRLAAAGDLDAVVDVYRKRRSKLDPVDCDEGDDSGRASLDFAAARGQTYLVRVSRLPASADATFALGLTQARPAATAPGRRLRRRGARGRLDRVLRSSASYSVRMRAGRSYRVNLDSGTRACLNLELYGPGTRGSFDAASPVRTLPCNGYFVFTPGPGESGRYSLRVLADRSFRAPEPFRLTVRRAGPDDLAPGRFLRNHRTARGRLDGRSTDVYDLYRFDVTHRSALDLDLAVRGRQAAFDLVLLSDHGRRLRCACTGGQVAPESIVTRLRAGRYFAAVRAVGGAHGRYRLHRATRTITATTTTIDNVRHATSRPGSSVTVGAHVAPGAAGPVRITVERFDPVQGWQFVRRVRRTAHSGLATYAFTPSRRGRWRARTEFLGTRDAAPSASRYASVLVAGPLVE